MTLDDNFYSAIRTTHCGDPGCLLCAGDDPPVKLSPKQPVTPQDTVPNDPWCHWCVYRAQHPKTDVTHGWDGLDDWNGQIGHYEGFYVSEVPPAKS